MKTTIFVNICNLISIGLLAQAPTDINHLVEIRGPETISDAETINERDQRIATITYNKNAGENVSGQLTYLVHIDKGTDTGYKKRLRYQAIENVYKESKNTGELFNVGKNQIGWLKLENIDKDAAQGTLTIKTGLSERELPAFNNIQILNSPFKRLSFKTSVGISENTDPFYNQTSLLAVGGQLEYNLTEFLGAGLFFSTTVSGTSTGIRYFGFHGSLRYRISRGFAVLLSIGKATSAESYYLVWSPEFNNNAMRHTEKLTPLFLSPGVSIRISELLSFNITTHLLPALSFRSGFGLHVY